MMTKAEKVILEIVNEVSKVYPEGEQFFDHLDEKLQTEAPSVVLEELFARIPKGIFLVLSGGFGKQVAEGIDNGTYPSHEYILYKGGIRSGANPEIIRDTLSGGSVVSGHGIFLDDSIYGGATYRALQKVIGSGILRECWVIYDGCPVVREDIKSIFRYYDHFKAKPNYEFPPKS